MNEDFSGKTCAVIPSVTIVIIKIITGTGIIVSLLLKNKKPLLKI